MNLQVMCAGWETAVFSRGCGGQVHNSQRSAFPGRGGPRFCLRSCSRVPYVWGPNIDRVALRLVFKIRLRREGRNRSWLEGAQGQNGASFVKPLSKQKDQGA